MKTLDAPLPVKPLEDWSDSELITAERAVSQDSPEYLIDSGYLEIKTKEAELVPLRLNKIQQKIRETIKGIKAAGKPVRIWILKFRQGGCSTYIEGKIFSETSQRANVNSLIMADQKDKSSHIFEMSKLFQEMLEKNHPHLVGELKRSNEKKLEWQGIHSQIIIASAENVDAARAFTYQFVHLSEVAYFPDLGSVLKALLQAVPDHKETIVIGETTANGLGGDFYDEWNRSKRGESDWVALFLPWFWMDEYCRSLALDGGRLYPVENGLVFDTDGGLADFLNEENHLRKNHGLREDQINWRRWCIVNKCKGEVSAFRQEYPADDQEAFLVSGKCIFDKIRLKNQKLHVKQPLGIGNLVELDGKSVWRENERGLIKIYEWPTKEGQYCGGADSSRTLYGDPSAGVILNKKSNRTAAVIHGHIDPDQFAYELKRLGNFYNGCLIAPENNDAGHTTCHKLHEIYGNVFVKTDKDGKTIKEIGWKTTSVSRPDMISELKQEIREDATELMDEALIDECLNFIENEDGKLAAAPSCHDDLVIARMIAGKMRQLSPYVAKKQEWKTAYKEKQNSGSVWAA